MRMEEAQSSAQDWFTANELLLNPTKTQTLFLSLKNLDEQEPIRFLGVLLDPKLQWNVHLDSVANKLSSATFMLRNLAKQCLT